MKNILEVIVKDLKRQVVRVLLPGHEEERSLFLMGILAKTSMLEDFKITYAGKLTMTELLAAKQVFGESETENKYAVFVDHEFKLIFAVNILFGDYDEKQRIVVYKTPQEILLKAPLVKMLMKTKDPLMVNLK